MDNDFHPWGAGLAMTAAALVISGAWALATDQPIVTFLSLFRFAVSPLLLPLIHTAVRFLADISRWAWERGYWRSKPYMPEPKPEPRPVIADWTPILPPAPGMIAYNIGGIPQPSIARLTAAEVHEAQWREACVAFLQAGHELGDTWTIRVMTGAGIVSDPDWRAVVGVLSGAGLLTTEGRTQPYPDYRGALSELKHGRPLPHPGEPAPRISQTHATTQHTQAATVYAAEK